MNQNPQIAELYRDTVYTIKTEKEFDYDNLKRIHDRFDFFKEEDNTFRRPKSRFDLQDSHYMTEEEILSTEMSDLADNEIYLRYKISKQELKESKEEFEKR